MGDYIYSSPEKYGLRVIGEVEFSSGCYEFDTFVLWQDVETADFFCAQDSGCSCPMPFESFNRSNITKVEKLQHLIDLLEDAKKQCYRYDSAYYGEQARAEIDGECAALISKYREVRA